MQLLVLEAGKNFLVRLETLPTSHHLLSNTSATNWVSVLKKSLHRSFLVIFTLSTLLFLLASRLLSSVWRLKSVVCRNLSNVKWKSSLPRGKKVLQQCLTKRNPIGSENMTGLARVIRGHMVTAYENVALWHERDISHSSAERIITPDTTILIDYMLNRFGNIVKNLTVFPENMIRNMNSTFGLIFSQRAMLTLIEKA